MARKNDGRTIRNAIDGLKTQPLVGLAEQLAQLHEDFVSAVQSSPGEAARLVHSLETAVRGAVYDLVPRPAKTPSPMTDEMAEAP